MTDRESSVKQWVNDFTGALYDRACYKLGDDELAKDLVQETFMAAYENFGTFEGRSNAKTWLMSILNYKIIDHYRRQLKNPVMSENDRNFFDDDGRWKIDKRPGPWESEPNLLDDMNFVTALRACMEKLPAKWLAAIQLKYMSGKDGTDVCADMGIAPANYWQIIRRAKLNLRECLNKNWFKL